ncbi:MAG: C4-dicarboxylate ABC transporter substrate-binding protein [Rhodobacteraceae bacterium]|nr:C4-dicarboxylate ABC transporter substrate-binding protein [Paracoccaceae bacterium]MAY44182.1 C4-dicarboxylate ABC transporter substrate-binding protein [Paracoccaceae bacterium]QEW21007.1 C4-dicarboxylate-binding periplasmic protein precursor [Marinibacterium anthonyi]
MKLFGTITAIGLALLATGAVQASEIKIAMNSVDDPATSGEASFAHGFADALDGTDFTVEIYPSETLGKEKERLDQVAQGLLEVDLAAASTVYAMSPLLKGVTLPFYFTDDKDLDAAIDAGDLMPAFNEPLLDNGIRLVGLNYIGVPMGIHNSKMPISTMDDITKLRFRALNPEQLELIEAMGSHGTIIAWAEVANAIQTGVADGYFNPPNSAIRNGHTSFLKYFTPANLFPSSRAIVISEDWYQSLSDDEKAQIDKAIEAGIEANRAWLADWSTEVTATQEELGVTITPLADGEREKIVAVAKPLWAETLSPEQFQLWEDAKAASE